MGRNVSLGITSRSTASQSQTLIPSACPAAMATPKAVISWLCALTTGMPLISACSCISRSFLVSLPSTFSLVSGMPQSLFMASRMSLVWKQIASRAALMMCCFVEKAVKPHIILRGHVSLAELWVTKKLTHPLASLRQ